MALTSRMLPDQEAGMNPSLRWGEGQRYRKRPGAFAPGFPFTPQ